MDDIFLVFYLLPASSFSTWLGPTRRIREREKKDLSRCLIQGQPARYGLSFSTVKTLISSFFDMEILKLAWNACIPLVHCNFVTHLDPN